MDPDTYQKLAARTECSQLRAARVLSDRTVDHGSITLPVRILHAALGITKEGGELLALVEKRVYYGQEFPNDKFVDELGDVLWYAAQLCNAVGVSLSDVMRKNLAKLQARYPDRYTDERAATRDREAERKAVALDDGCGINFEPADPKAGTYRRRTKAEVRALQSSSQGCCNRHADNQSCDCYERAASCVECNDTGWVGSPQNGWNQDAYRCPRGCPVSCSVCRNQNCDTPNGQH